MALIFPSLKYIQLYSLPTPNAVNASIMLEEAGLPYEAPFVSFGAEEQMKDEFLSLNPNNKILGDDRPPMALAVSLSLFGTAVRF